MKGKKGREGGRGREEGMIGGGRRKRGREESGREEEGS